MICRKVYNLFTIYHFWRGFVDKLDINRAIYKNSVSIIFNPIQLHVHHTNVIKQDVCEDVHSACLNENRIARSCSLLHAAKRARMRNLGASDLCLLQAFQFYPGAKTNWNNVNVVECCVLTNTTSTKTFKFLLSLVTQLVDSIIYTRFKNYAIGPKVAWVKCP